MRGGDANGVVWHLFAGESWTQVPGLLEHHRTAATVDDGPLAILTTDTSAPSALSFLARRSFSVPAWRVRLWLSGNVGRALRWVLIDGFVAMSLLVLTVCALLAVAGSSIPAVSVAGGWILIWVAVTSWTARRRVLIGDFRDLSHPDTEAGAPTAPAVDLSDLLLGEISRIVDLFHVVGDRRAVSSGFGPERAFDATLSADGLLGTLRGTVSPESKASIGPVTFPVAPILALLGAILQAPRLTGSLHRDGQTLILTAEISRRRGLTWSVRAPLNAGDNGSNDQSSSDDETERAVTEESVTAMVRQLSLRVFTDVALGRSVRWGATEAFVEGLQSFRVCLRTPRDRKFNLKHAEKKFLEALTEDEAFPLAHYNLGVVYTELHGLAVAAGRMDEAEMHLSAAEIAFGRAIDKDPTRWETYFAFAQTQYRYNRWQLVLDLAERIEALTRRLSDRAQTDELAARALIAQGKYPEANKRARRASRRALRSLEGARLFRRGLLDAEHDQVSSRRELAAGCLLTFGNIFSRQMTPAGELSANRLVRWREDRMLRRTESMFKLARLLTRAGADVRFEFGLRALCRGRLDIAVNELEAATSSDPTRPIYAAGLALARLRQNPEGKAPGTPVREDIEQLCWRALEGMAAAFFPSRDADACGIVAIVYEELGEDAQANQLTELAKAVKRNLGKAASEAAISAYCQQALEQSDIAEPKWGRGKFVRATAHACSLLAEGQEPAGRQDVQELDAHRAAVVDKLREALKEAERATSLNPLSRLAWETLGDVYRELSDFRNARLSWQFALGADPDNPELYNKIGSSYWNIAFERVTETSRTDLEAAAEQFSKALVLYGSGNFDEQLLTHYRLGKINAALRKFGEARSHLMIVEAMDDQPPIVGWVQLGLAYLQQRSYSECEGLFGQVIREGERLGETCPPDRIMGDRLDEKLWPLSLVRAWGHLGLAFSVAERDGDFDAAKKNIRLARTIAKQVDARRFPNRILAGCDNGEGFILLRQGEIDDAIKKLNLSVSSSPYSRCYLHLAIAQEKRAMRDEGGLEGASETLRRLLQHARCLGLRDVEVDEMLSRLDNSNSHSPAEALPA